MTERTSILSPLTLLKAWHAWLAGAFLVAYLTASEDTYGMHQFAGYAVLAAIVTRIVAGLFVSGRNPWRLPRPSLRASREWLAARKGRNPLFGWFAAALLIGIGLAAGTGAIADGATWMEHPHEAISEASLWVIAGHVAFVAYMYGGRKWIGRVATGMGGLRPSITPKETLP